MECYLPDQGLEVSILHHEIRLLVLISCPAEQPMKPGAEYSTKVVSVLCPSMWNIGAEADFTFLE